jgi:hypothetical protein
VPRRSLSPFISMDEMIDRGEGHRSVQEAPIAFAE